MLKANFEIDNDILFALTVRIVCFGILSTTIFIYIKAAVITNTNMLSGTKYECDVEERLGHVEKYE